MRQHTPEVNRLVLAFHIRRVQIVTAVQELHQVVRARSNSHVILNAQVLQTLDQPSLHIASLGRFDRRVHQALAATHRVKKELSRGEAAVEAVLHEALGGRYARVLVEMRQ